jgi:tetratricopeptide (TPR) repeat protein
LTERDFTISDGSYRIDDVARSVIRETQHQEDKQKFCRIHNWIADYFEQLVNKEVSPDRSPIDKYENSEWQDLMIEVIYHRLFANNNEGKRQLLTCFFEGAYLKKPLIAISAFLAIASEAKLKENELLRGDIKNFLDSIEKTIVFGWWVIGRSEKNYSISIKRQGEEVSSQIKSQIESGLRVCFPEIQNLTGLAKCTALVSHSLRSYSDQGALSLLNQAYAEIETLKNFDNTHFLSDIFFDLALAFYSKDLHEQALISINKSLDIESEKSHYYAIKSAILANLEYYEEALVSINEAIKIDPKTPNYYSIKSMFLTSLKRYNDALISCEEAIKIDPQINDPYHRKGVILSLMGDDPAAINSCERAIQLGGNKPLLLVNKGIVLSRAGEYSKAMNLFDGVIREHPENEEGYYGKACCYARQGDTEQAIAALQQAIQIAPRRCCREARRNPDFDSLRNDQQFISLVGESPSRDRSSIDVDRT